MGRIYRLVVRVPVPVVVGDLAMFLKEVFAYEEDSRALV